MFLIQDLFAFTAVLSSLFVITSKNPVVSVIFLISVFVNSALYLILSGISFIGISYIIVYVGAIAILFLFILMMINIRLTDILEVGKEYTKNLPLALMVGSLFILAMVSILPFSFQDVSLLSGANIILNIFNSLLSDYSLSIQSVAIHVSNYPFNADAQLLDFNQIESLGHNLYTSGSILFIFTSLILLLSMLAPIVLSNLYKNNNINS
jgi:NADH-ubiquinone oxidoreductase chain 6